ncbi:MAG: RNA pyrophosphohydrolase [Alphaproteobacteria bacterium RIFCSPHIGHO2_02_FULL_46_13]|nr:MAG: RNA pyrophosphohydrolase [Alphaproteobacteria bacterium RIFCSPHIGHO2_02_FULL_46_13]
MTQNTNLPYRPCVGLVLFNQNGHVFMGRRIDNPDGWQMPQGGVDEGEDIQTAALSELQEEVGTNKVEIIRIADQRICYDVPMELSTKHWGGKYRGQEQTWVALRFTGVDTDINLNSHTPPEFDAWKWIPLSETVDAIVPFKRETYAKVIELFKDIK